MEATSSLPLMFLAARETTPSRPLPSSIAAPNALANLDFGVTSMTLLYTAILLSYASRHFKSYRKGHKDIIIIHSLSGLSELTQFYLPISSTASAVPAAAVFLCLIQCATNLILVRTLTRGIPALVRPVYQAGALLRTVFVLAAYAGASHELWHDSIVIIHAFAYTRLICFLFTTASAFTDTEVSEGAGAGAEIKGMSKLSVAQTYTVAVYGAALVSMGQMQHVFVGRYAAVAFLVIVAVVMRLEGWVERQMVLVAGCEMKRGCLGDHVAYLLYRIGICKLEVLLQMDRRVTA